MNTLIDPFQRKIWSDKYQYKDESYKEFCSRLSNNIFKDEKIKNKKLFDMLMDFKVLFGGRINANIGVSEEGLTLFNCFIESVTKNPDSLEGILDMLGKFSYTLKSEGGVGFCANFFRPAKTLIRKIGVGSPGSIKFLEIFDKVSEVITSGSVDKNDSYQGIPTKKSIRKGATMVTMSINHPDIESFIVAKATPNKLTKMNMSVLISDAFMYAVQNDMDWDLWFPDINFERYDELWDGNFEKWAEKGFPVVIYKTVRADYLWELLLRNSYTRNEPGILFIDNARKMNNISYLNGDMLSTNPCFTGDMLLHTSKGMERIHDLYIDGKDNIVYVDNRKINGNLGTTRLLASNVYKTGNKDVYKITTNSGYEIKATEYHGFSTDIGDKQLKDLIVGDKLRICSGECGFGENGNYDFGRLIGLITGDGTIYNGWNKIDNCKSNVVIARLWGKDNCLIDEITNTINSLILQYGGDYSNVIISKQYIKQKDMFEVRSAVLYRIFDSFNLLNIKKNVPDYIFKGSKEMVIGYLQGLFQSDGTVAVDIKSRCSIRLSSSEPTLLKDVQILLSNFGIRSSIYFRRKAGYRKLPDGKGGMKEYWCRDQYELILCSISRDIFMKEIGFMLPYKNNKFDSWREHHEPYKQSFYDPIKFIEFVGKEDVYCLTQKDYGSVICNGLSTLQCGEIFGHTGIEYVNGKAIELGDVCNLGSLNLTKFFDVDKNKFCLIEFKEAIDIMVNALDNVIEISSYPLPMYEQAAKLKRKIGIGLMGIGSLMMMMNLRYGGEECLDVLDVILKEFINQAYKSSALLAKEKGPFELYSPELIECGYVKNGTLSKEVIDLIKKHGLRHSALSAIAPTGCLVDDTLISTSKGCLEISDSKEISLYTDSLELSSDFKNSSFKGWYDKGYSKTVKITTHNGYSIEGTLPHKVRTINNNGEYIWKELKDILVDDVVVMKKDFIFNDINTTDMNENLAELLGFYMAEGWFCNNRLYFQIHTDEEEYITKLITSCFSDKYTRIIIRKRDDTNSLRIEVNSKEIREWFDKNICVKNGSSNAFIPKIIMCSNRNIIYSFIKGYFLGDGGFNISKQCVRFTTVSEKMANQLHTILLGIGIPSHIYTEQTVGKEIEILHRKTKSNFNAIRIELSVFNSRKLCKLMGVDSKKIDIKYVGRNFEPVLLLPKEHHIFSRDTFIKKYLDKGIICVTNSIYRRKIKKDNYNWFIENNMFLDTISTINNSNILKHVQDISVNDSSQTYVANGFITHNTLSIVAGNISGGVEPVFAREFTRWNRSEGKAVDFKYPNVHIGEWFETEYFKEEKVADEVVLISTDGKFRIDSNTGLCEKITIMDYGYKIALERGFTETATAMELSVEEHLKVLKLVSSYTDQGISKTINLPNDISFDSFKSLYGDIHSYGVKGCTTYREGTSIAVLEIQKKEQEKSVEKQQTEFLEVFEEQKNGDIITSDIQLPEEYPAKGYILKSDGKKYYLHVAFKDRACTRPFAIFVNTNNREDNVLTFNALEKLEEIAVFKNINNYFVEETKKKYAGQKNPVKICRMLGLLLRHNVDVFTIVKGLSELEAIVGTFVFHITKFLGRFVKEHDVHGMVCPECGEKSMKFYEGCISCTCGYSRCG